MTYIEARRDIQCLGKEHYGDRALAEKVKRRRARHCPKLEVYRCPHCRDWHIGNGIVRRRA